MSKSCLVYNFSSEVAKEIAKKTGSQISDKIVDILIQLELENGMLTRGDIHGKINKDEIAAAIIADVYTKTSFYEGQRTAQEFKETRVIRQTAIPLFMKRGGERFLHFRAGLEIKHIVAFDRTWRSILQTFGSEFAHLVKSLEDMQVITTTSKTEKADDVLGLPLFVSQEETPVVEAPPAQIASDAAESATSDNSSVQNDSQERPDAPDVDVSTITYSSLFERYLGKEVSDTLKFVKKLDDPKKSDITFRVNMGPISKEAKDGENYKEMEAAGLTLADNTLLAMTLNNLVFQGKADGSAVKELYEAIKLKRNIKDDTGNIIC